MKRFGIISTTALFVFLATTVTVYAQPNQQEKQGKTAEQSQHGGPAQHDRNTSKAQQSRPAHQNVQQSKPVQQQRTQQRAQAGPAQQEQRTQQKRAPQQHVQQTRHGQQNQQAGRVANNRSSRIPDDRFRANFGQTHMFRINHPTVVGGASRFQYGGYWFGFRQPWPVGWYYSDDVYVDYVDGAYFLYDPVHPGIRISIDIL